MQSHSHSYHFWLFGKNAEIWRNEPFLRQFASKLWFRSHSTFRPMGLSRHLLRVFCLVAGAWYAWANLTAEVKIAWVLNGTQASPTEFVEQADAAIARFPFDPMLRRARLFIRQQVAEHAGD